MPNDSQIHDDLDALISASHEQVAGWRECLVTATLRTMPEDTRAKVIDIMDNHPTVKSTDLIRKLGEWGYTIPYNSMIRHRRRGKGGAGCSCP